MKNHQVKELIEEAYFEVLEEQQMVHRLNSLLEKHKDRLPEDSLQKILDWRDKGNDLSKIVNVLESEEEEGFADSPDVIPTASDEMLAKFPTLKKTVKSLLSKDYEEFVKQVEWIAPKPSTFRVVLKSGQDFILKWTGKDFEAQILGKKYFLGLDPEYQQALDKIVTMLKDGPIDTQGGEGEGEPADDMFGGASGGGGDFPGGDESGAAPEFGGGEEGGAEPGGVEGGEEGGEDLDDEPIDFEEPDEEPDF